MEMFQGEKKEVSLCYLTYRSYALNKSKLHTSMPFCFFECNIPL